MKKIMLFFLGCFLIGLIIGWNLDILNDNPKSFEIYQSYIFTGGDYKRTELKVIVYETGESVEMLYSEIQSFHDGMNGVSDELNIELYDSKKSLLKGDFLSEHTYFK